MGMNYCDILKCCAHENWMGVGVTLLLPLSCLTVPTEDPMMLTECPEAGQSQGRDMLDGVTM